MIKFIRKVLKTNLENHIKDSLECYSGRRDRYDFGQYKKESTLDCIINLHREILNFQIAIAQSLGSKYKTVE